MVKQNYVLPQELTIYEVDETFQELSSLLDDGVVITLDGSHIEEIDTAGLQLILWCLQHDAAEPVTVIQSSEKVAALAELFNVTLETVNG
jgi:ABC-type transporter Mla MlaB component